MAYECGITAVILPEFDRCMETTQNNPHHKYSVGEHTIVSIGNARPDRILRYAMLMHDFGKPSCKTTDDQGIDHFYGHQEVSARMANDILRRLKSDNDTRKSVAKLVRYHDLTCGLTGKSVRKAISLIGEDLFPLYLEVKDADTRAQSDYRLQEKLDYLQEVRSLYRKIKESGDCLTLKDLAVNGSDLISAGMEPGKEIGKVLADMLEDVISDPSHNNKEYLMAIYVTGHTGTG